MNIGCHFSEKGYNFNTHAKLILIELLRHININKGRSMERLKERENFWILALETLTSKGLNQELN